MTQNNITPPASLGFIGLGNMGKPMATRLIDAGYQLTVADLNTEALTQFCSETGALPADSLQTLGAASQVVITMLPEGKAVRKVLLDEQGVVSGLKADSILIDMSSCSPVDTRELAAELAQKGFSMIDAPVSGGVVKAVDGSLAIMAGGLEEKIEACRPVLETLGKLFLTGGPGTGHAMKAMNNFLSAATLAVTSEAVLIGKEFGLEADTMVNIINASTGRSNSSEHKFPTFVLPETYNSGFFMGLMAKDLRFAKELGESMQTPHELLSVISNMWNSAEDELGFQSDNTEVYRHLENQLKPKH